MDYYQNRLVSLIFLALWSPSIYQHLKSVLCDQGPLNDSNKAFHIHSYIWYSNFSLYICFIIWWRFLNNIIKNSVFLTRYTWNNIFKNDRFGCVSWALPFPSFSGWRGGLFFLFSRCQCFSYGQSEQSSSLTNWKQDRRGSG